MERTNWGRSTDGGLGGKGQMNLTRKMAVAGTALALVGSLATPAMAASGSSTVNVTLTSGGGTRTLSLFQPDGTSQLTATDLSQGTSNFIAKVLDSGYSNSGFNVQATMSNLYAFANNAYNCNSMVPSSAVSLSSPTGLLTVGGVSSLLTPVFSITGNLTALNILDPLLLNPVSVVSSVTGLLPGSLPLTQSQLTGSGATNLVGSVLSSVESLLPVSLGTSGLGGAFTSPDVHPTCDAAATGATPVSLMNGTANPTGLLNDLVSQITSLLGTSTPTLTQLINAGFLNSSAVSTALQSVTGLLGQLGLTGLTNDLSSIENVLTATISSSGLSLLPGVTNQSGNYSSSPSLTVNTSKIPAAGTYKGVMTVTLLDT